MARTYKVAADTSEKEKIIGGILTVYQGGWILLGILISAGLFFLLQLLLPPLAALVLAAPPGGVFAFLFAFYRRQDLPFATWLLYRSRFRHKSGYLVNTLTFRKDFRHQPPLF